MRDARERQHLEDDGIMFALLAFVLACAAVVLASVELGLAFGVALLAACWCFGASQR